MASQLRSKEEKINSFSHLLTLKFWSMWFINFWFFSYSLTLTTTKNSPLLALSLSQILLIDWLIDRFQIDSTYVRACVCVLCVSFPFCFVFIPIRRFEIRVCGLVVGEARSWYRNESNDKLPVLSEERKRFLYFIITIWSCILK